MDRIKKIIKEAEKQNAEKGVTWKNACPENDSRTVKANQYEEIEQSKSSEEKENINPILERFLDDLMGRGSPPVEPSPPQPIPTKDFEACDNAQSGELWDAALNESSKPLSPDPVFQPSLIDFYESVSDSQPIPYMGPFIFDGGSSLSAGDSKEAKNHTNNNADSQDRTQLIENCEKLPDFCGVPVITVVVPSSSSKNDPETEFPYECNIEQSENIEVPSQKDLFIDSAPASQKSPATSQEVGIDENNNGVNGESEIIDEGEPQLPDLNLISNNSSPSPDSQEKSKSNKKYERRTNMCFYCEPQTPQKNLVRHLTGCHQDVDKVQRLMALKKNSRERRLMADEIRKDGNFLYYGNNATGVTRPSRKVITQSPPKARDYVNCKLCFVTIKRKVFYRHLAVCSKNSDNKMNCPKCKEEVRKGYLMKHLRKCSENYDVVKEPKKSNSAKIQKRVIQDYTLTQHTWQDVSEDELDDILPTLRPDDLGEKAKQDSLILKVAALYRQNHKEDRAKVQITSKMRDLQRLVDQMKKSNDSINNLRDCLESKNSKLLLKAVQSLSGLNAKTGEVKIPSLPKRIYTPINMAFSLLLKEIRLNPDLTVDLKKTLSYDLKVSQDNLKDTWRFKISTNAEKSRRRIKRNKGTVMPTAKDVRTALAYIKDKEQVLYASLKKKPTPIDFEKLCKLVIADIIVFNGRRSGEAVRATLNEYLNRKEIQYEEGLNLIMLEEDLEAKKKLTVFETEGKLCKNVTVYLTHAMQKCVDLLITLRSAVGVKTDNPLLFPRTAVLKPYDATWIMSELRTSEGLNLEIPEAMTGQGVRREIATHSQIRNPNKAGYVELLASHMGHNEKTHRENYRLPMQTLLMTQVGTDLINRRLFANKKEKYQLDFDAAGEKGSTEIPSDADVDKPGEACPSTSGKLTELPHEESPNVDDGNDEISVDDGNDEISVDDNLNSEKSPNSKLRNDSEGSDTDQSSGIDLELIRRKILKTKTVKRKTIKRQTAKRKTQFKSNQEEHSLPKRMRSSDAPQFLSCSQRKKAKHVPWTADQERLVLTLFVDCFQQRKNPGEKRCYEAICNNPILQGRTWAQLNAFIDNTRRRKRPILAEFAWLLEL